MKLKVKLRRSRRKIHISKTNKNNKNIYYEKNEKNNKITKGKSQYKLHL